MDADGHPLQGATVLMMYEKICGGLGGAVHEAMGSGAADTDADGRFEIPARGWTWMPFGCTRVIGLGYMCYHGGFHIFQDRDNQGNDDPFKKDVIVFDPLAASTSTMSDSVMSAYFPKDAWQECFPPKHPSNASGAEVGHTLPNAVVARNSAQVNPRFFTSKKETNPTPPSDASPHYGLQVGPEYYAKYVEDLFNPKASVRDDAVMRLYWCAVPVAFNKRLLQALESDDPYVVERAGQCLTVKDPSTIHALRRLARSHLARHRFAAEYALFSRQVPWKDPHTPFLESDADIVAEGLDVGNPALRQDMLEILGVRSKTDRSLVIPLAEHASMDPDKRLVTTAMRFLNWLKPSVKESTAGLIASVGRASPKQAAAALRNIGRAGPAAAPFIGRLRALCAASDPRVRRAARKALAQVQNSLLHTSPSVDWGLPGNERQAR